jgi:predicted  nucleic acid-binding Zn-ribbon protein
MKRDRLNTELQALERKVRLLLNQLNQSKKDAEALKNENQALKEIISSKEQQLLDFQNKIKISTIVDSISVGNNEATEVKSQIDEYIKEIDKCINQLSK